MALERWLDRAAATIAPRWQLARVQARLALSVLQRHYEGAGEGRRTQGWRRPATDANLAAWASIARLRNAARDLVRNNGYAEAALATIGDHVVGEGIVARPKPVNEAASRLWRAWAETTDCDADARHDFAGLQKLVMTSVAESGEVLVRRRLRPLTDGFPIPLQLQVLEADYLDTNRTMPLPTGAIIQGVEFDLVGRRVAYWLFPRHPGSFVTTNATIFTAARRIPASEILHVYKMKRPGQVRAVSWFAPVLLRFKDFDEFEDATLMKQKVAALLSVITSDQDGTAMPIGTAQDGSTADAPQIDALEPGAILNIQPGRSIEVVQPPNATDYEPYCRVSLRAIATGLGVGYEDLTGDYTGMPFSAARMSRQRHYARVADWRWRLLIPQFCGPAWDWAMQAAVLAGLLREAPIAEWTAPPAPVLQPEMEGIAAARRVRAGVASQSEVMREAGYDPDELFAEIAADNTRLDELRIVLDSDARKTSQAGQVQANQPAAPPDGAAS